jgi:hypothetical protein
MVLWQLCQEVEEPQAAQQGLLLFDSHVQIHNGFCSAVPNTGLAFT